MGRVTQSSSGGAVTIIGPVDVEPIGFDTLTSPPGQISVEIVSTTLLSANANRKYAHISNNSGNTIFIQYSSSAALNTGIKMPPNTVYTIESNNLWLGSVNAIGVVGGQLIDILEGE